jgi:hypothetical protein
MMQHNTQGTKKSDNQNKGGGVIVDIIKNNLGFLIFALIFIATNTFVPVLARDFVTHAKMDLVIQVQKHKIEMINNKVAAMDRRWNEKVTSLEKILDETKKMSEKLLFQLSGKI